MKIANGLPPLHRFEGAETRRGRKFGWASLYAVRSESKHAKQNQHQGWHVFLAVTGRTGWKRTALEMQF
jgi:hypothetical protein